MIFTKTSLGREPYPGMLRTGNSLWDRTISTQMERFMRDHPGEMFVLNKKNGAPLVLPKNDVGALRNSASPGFRVQTVPVEQVDHKGRPYRRVWVSYDPEYWDRIAQRKQRKQWRADYAPTEGDDL